MGLPRTDFRNEPPTGGGTRRPRRGGMLLLLAIASLVVSACAGRVSTDVQPVPTASEACIQNEQGTGCLPVGPESARVDLAPPTFSHPTRVDNPLHPTGVVSSELYLGRVGGLPFRTEVTLLPGTRTIEWNGQAVEVLESQYFAYLDGRIHEVALDWYAQADDGSVWYLGEDVFNYEDGVLADIHGTWQAGRDGPAAMIMPANPAVGDTYRPENAPGIVFEEVTVQSTDVTVGGPDGPVPGAIVVRELHMDGSFEAKTFAPGYGEFTTGGGNDLEAIALAVPTNARSGPVPAELRALTDGANRIYEIAGGVAGGEAQTAFAEISAAWEATRALGIPPMLESQMVEGLAALDGAVKTQRAAEIRQAAIGVARAAYDLQLMYRPAADIDLARFELMVRQLGLDVASGDAGAVAGDATTLEWIRDRFVSSLSAAEAGEVNGLLERIRTAADGEDLQAAEEYAARLGDVLAAILPTD